MQETGEKTIKEDESVEFFRTQVVSLVWVCVNILWEASSGKVFYKAVAVIA